MIGNSSPAVPHSGMGEVLDIHVDAGGVIFSVVGNESTSISSLSEIGRASRELRLNLRIWWGLACVRVYTLACSPDARWKCSPLV